MDIFFNPSKSDPPKVMISIDKISKALCEAGYKNMSSIIEKQLTSIVPFNEHERDRIILYKNNSITIFAPPDEALGMENSMDLRYQVAISKVQKEDFDTSDGYDVRTLYNYGRSLMIRLVPERVILASMAEMHEWKHKKYVVANTRLTEAFTSGLLSEGSELVTSYIDVHTHKENTGASRGGQNAQASGGGWVLPSTEHWNRTVADARDRAEPMQH
ncbi:hypothetical protein GH714_028811 [Hevea brasiliensis]|uniref:Uncharacterized protein n=1 Tax=Hevea brasiliensis TaxID=3981 RepID=A0A6A6M3R2_HEVBR|nr:hypothetical protein GH714_028811 [Hevea brasiliensis]